MKCSIRRGWRESTRPREPMSIDVLPHWITDLIAPRPPENNRLALPGASQCGYELLRAFSRYADSRRLRFSLAAGTLLGAMRNRPSGLLQWEHVDIYMPARDALELLRHLPRLLRRPLSWRAVVPPRCTRGLVDRNGASCCGFGFKLFHRKATRRARRGQARATRHTCMERRHCGRCGARCSRGRGIGCRPPGCAQRRVRKRPLLLRATTCCPRTCGANR